VPNVGGSVGQVVVAGANTDDEEKFEYAFMLSPPIFTRIEVRTKVGGTDKLVWAIGRTRQSDGTWSRRIAPVEGVLSDVDSKARVEFTVTASRSMGQIRLRVRNGGKWEEVRLKSVSKTLRVRRGEISLARLRGFLSGRPAGNVRIRLRGEDVNDIRIDPDPETPAKLNPDLTVTGWEGITDADGGWEEHDIPVGFNEVWEETNLLNNETTTFVVSRQGDSLKAVNPMYVYDGKKTGANVSLDFEFRKVPQMAGKRWYSNGRRIASPSTAIVRKLFADHAGKLSIGYRMKEISPTEMRGTFESFQIEYRDGVLGDFTPRSTMWNVVWRKKKPAPTGSTPKTP
jgi:hypothetical protein